MTGPMCADAAPPGATPTELFARAQAGDEDAFAQWVAATVSLTHRLVFRMVGAAEADDVVQDAYIKAWSRIAQVRRAEDSTGWLCRIARNTAHDALRRRKPVVSLDVEGGLWLDRLSSDEPLPDEVLRSAEARAFVTEALGALKEKHRLVIVLKELDGLGEQEVAQALGIPVGTVTSRLTRAREAFGKELRRRIRLGRRR